MRKARPGYPGLQVIMNDKLEKKIEAGVITLVYVGIITASLLVIAVLMALGHYKASALVGLVQSVVVIHAIGEETCSIGCVPSLLALPTPIAWALLVSPIESESLVQMELGLLWLPLYIMICLIQGFSKVGKE